METIGQDTPIDVVVLAGGVNKIPLYQGYEEGYKALIPYKGKASIRYVLDALKDVKGIRRVAVVGPVEPLRKELSDRTDSLEFVEDGENFYDSLLTGLSHFRDSRNVFFVTADLPLLTTGAIEEFLSACAAAPSKFERNLYVSVVPKDYYTGPFAHFPKPYHTFRDMRVGHGNLFLIDPRLLDETRLHDRVNWMYAHRKTPLSMFALGWQVALMYIIGAEILHLVTLRGLADFASKKLGFGVVPVAVKHPEITVDVDGPKEYEFVRERLGDGPEPVTA